MLQHKFLIEKKDGSKETRTSTLCEYGAPTGSGGYSAMERLVGIPCAVGKSIRVLKFFKHFKYPISSRIRYYEGSALTLPNLELFLTSLFTYIWKGFLLTFWAKQRSNRYWMVQSQKKVFSHHCTPKSTILWWKSWKTHTGEFCKSNYLDFVLKKVLASSARRRLFYKVNRRQKRE